MLLLLVQVEFYGFICFVEAFEDTFRREARPTSNITILNGIELGLLDGAKTRRMEICNRVLDGPLLIHIINCNFCWFWM
jgi:hypothetical protein